MKIADSNVTMAANRQYRQSGVRNAGGNGVAQTFLQTAARTQVSRADTQTISGEERDAALYPTYDAAGFGGFYGSGPGGAFYNRGFGMDLSETRGAAIGTVGQSQESLFSTRSALLQELLSRILKSSLYFSGLSGMTSLLSGGAGVGATMLQQTYYEEESASFAAQGRAVTEDGRVLDFNVDLLMSRSFVQYTQIQLPVLQTSLLDPLMINVGAACANISDQKFMFDLDADGVEEEISMTGKGTGFLALDLNEDGVINDGSELFGTRSGDGFEDLRGYDTDGNGWIDENDEVFSRLKVWYKNADGTDELIDLKTAGVGAIYLGAQATEFSLNGAGNRTNGVVRESGIFLYENGGAGTIQHVDLAAGRSGAANGTGDNAAGGSGAAEGEDAESDMADGAETADGAVQLSGAYGGTSVGTAGETVVTNGALVLNTEDGEAAGTTAASGTDTRRAAQERRTAQAREKQAAQERRTAEAQRRRAQLKRQEERRRMEQARIDRLFEDRAAARAEQSEALARDRAQEQDEQERLTKEQLEAQYEQERLTEERIGALEEQEQLLAGAIDSQALQAQQIDESLAGLGSAGSAA